MKKKVWIALLGVGVLAGAPWALTQAIFADAADVGSNAFISGSVDISTSPASALVTYSQMTPGDVVTAPVTVTNAGSLQFRYALSTAVSGSTALADGLTLAIKNDVTACTNGGFAADGTQLYAGSLTNGAIGDVTQGAQTGDRVLDAGGSETLCFQVQLPTSAPNALQNLSATATFTFSAEQTANN